jgi:hypothetical protein
VPASQDAIFLFHYTFRLERGYREEEQPSESKWQTVLLMQAAIWIVPSAVPNSKLGWLCPSLRLLAVSEKKSNHLKSKEQTVPMQADFGLCYLLFRTRCLAGYVQVCNSSLYPIASKSMFMLLSIMPMVKPCPSVSMFPGAAGWS